MDLSAYSSSLRLIRRNINVRHNEAMQQLQTVPVDSDLINAISFDVDELEKLKEKFRIAISEEIESLDRMNRSAESLLKEEESLADELSRVTSSIRAVVSKFVSLKTTFDRARNRESTNSFNNSRLNSSLAASAKFPDIKVPEFHGEIRRFTDFRNLFTSLVHENPDLTDIQKMHYLKGSVKGEASIVIRDFEISGQAYSEAWAHLCARYERKRLIIASHFGDLLALDSVKSLKNIRELLDKASAITRSLKLCGFKIGESESDAMSPFVSYIVSSKLDLNTRKDWENSVSNQQAYPSFANLCTFLNSRCYSFEEPANQKTGPSNPQSAAKNRVAEKNNVTNRNFNSKATLANSTNPTCCLCSGAHAVSSCKDFLSKDSHDRFDIVKQYRLCLKCLLPGHSTVECKSLNCSVCQKPHNALLHHERGRSANKENAKEDSSLPSTSKASLASVATINSMVVLPSAVIRVKIRNKFVFARVLLDSCSQPNLVTEQFVKKHKIRLYPSVGVPIDSVGSVTASNRFAKMSLNSHFGKGKLFIEADVVSRIPYSVSCSFNENMKVLFSDLVLAERCINYEGVDIIIGSRHFNRVVSDRRKFVGELCAQSSIFGWVVSGAEKSEKETSSCSLMTSYSIEDQIRDFWRIEEVESVSTASSDFAPCVTHFEKTVERESDGKFVVRLPFKTDRSKIGESRNRAAAALRKVEKSLKPDEYSEYIKFMREYEELGHMKKVPPHVPEPPSVYYMPHRAVLRPSSSTTKLRVVFNASSKSSSGISLNELLMVGPTVQPELFDTLVRFRSHIVAFCADISKMYRCIKVHKDDCDMQRILWRENSLEPVQSYRLTTVTYGTAPASFLATQCLIRVALDIADQHPEASRAIQSDFYMDDLLTGARSLEEALSVQSMIHKTLSSAHFPLRKYMSNSPKFLETLDSSLVEELKPLRFHNGVAISVLGLRWDPQKDYFRMSLELRDLSAVTVLTKRLILSEIARIFDPLGLVSPVTIRAKMIIQDLWREQKEWDDSVSIEIDKKFREYYSDLDNLCSFFVPRSYSEFADIVRLDLIGFSDASQKAYCAVIFVRTVNREGEVCVRLVCAKTRVAPIKELTIPRLELQAALLLAKLASRVSVELKIEPQNVHLFSDSSVVLSWLNASPDRWTVFVRNRVSKIQSLCSNQWCYVKTKENPADLATRGVDASFLTDCQLWKEGPSFLQNDTPFDCKFPHLESSKIPELRKEKISLGVFREEHSLTKVVCKYSCLDKLINVISYVRRFCRQSIWKGESLSAAERDAALKSIIVIFQANSFAKEVSLLKSGLPVSRSSSLCSLSPFLDNDGVLKLGGRLHNAVISEDKRHPIILHARSYLVELLVRHIHEKYFHVSRGFIVNYLLSKYWIVGGLVNVTKKVIGSCASCIRFRAQTVCQIMGQLPSARVNVSRPFSNVGVDFAGPFSAKCVAHRSTRFYKLYAAFFVCFVTRGVHIEIVSSLSTEDFLASLARFIARRGVPSVIHSDNATNFVGAQNLLFTENLELLRFAGRENFAWKFIPPRTPHQGGIWEAAVRAGKHHLLRVTKGQILNYEEYNTLFTKIEGIMNSRPLCYKSLPNQPGGVLTPAHFWLGSCLLRPDSFFEESGDLIVPLTRRYEQVHNQISSFWRIWSKDYLNQIQTMPKWRDKQRNLEVGDVVIVKDDLLAPGVWKLGSIIAVYADSLGAVRSVDVRSGGTIKRRGVSSLVLLCSDRDPVIRGSMLRTNSHSR